MNDDCGESRDTFITSTKRRFCVLQNGESPRYHCPELPGRLPALPPFHPPSTTEAPITTPLAGNVSSSTQPGDMTTTVFTLGNDTVTGTECCSPGLIVLVVLLIIAFFLVLTLIYFRYRRRKVVQEKYTPSKAEKANGTGQAASEEGVPLRNWNGYEGTAV